MGGGEGAAQSVLPDCSLTRRGRAVLGPAGVFDAFVREVRFSAFECVVRSG
jgi:hypothetical protein